MTSDHTRIHGSRTPHRRTAPCARCRVRAGSALVVVMGVIVLICAAAASMLALGQAQARLAVQSSDYLRAKLIAESGVSATYNLIKTNFTLARTVGAFSATPFAGGTYDPSVAIQGSNRALIACTGYYGTATAVAKADVVNVPLVMTNGTVPLTTAYGFSMFVNGYARFNGSSTFKGAIHANNYIDVNGNLTWGAPTELVWVEASGNSGFGTSGGGTIYGTVRAPSIGFSGSITDRRIETVPTLPMPVLDLAPYHATAVANGQVYGSTTISGKHDWGTIPGGVRWYDGTLTIKNNGSITYTGCVIATGAITIKGGCTCSRYGTAPSLISRDSTITFDGSQTTRGLIYSPGDIGFNGSGTHEGTIICGGNVIFNGSASVQTSFAYCEPGMVAPTNRTLDRVYITAWQD